MHVMSVALHSNFDTTDVDEAIDYLSLHYGPVRLHSAPLRLPLHATAVASADGRLRVAALRCESYVDATIVPARGIVTVAHTLAGRLVVHPSGEAPDSVGPAPTILPGGQDIQLRWAGLRAVTVQLSESALTAAAAEITSAGRTDTDAPAVRFTGRRPITPARGRYWTELVRHVAHDVLANPDASTSPIMVTSAVSTLAAAAIFCFPNTVQRDVDREGDSMGGATGSAVRRALAHMDDHLNAPLTLADIAGAAGVSPRALQRAFRSTLDTTPTRYLRHARLAQAHRDLRNAEPGRDTVKAIAARWGFAQADRFSSEYRAVFGVPPSHTLRG